MEILYYKEGEDHYVSISDEGISIIYNFDQEMILDFTIPKELEDQKEKIVFAVESHRQNAMKAIYPKGEIYQQITTLGGTPAWIKKSDVQDWMCRPRVKAEEVKEDVGN